MTLHSDHPSQRGGGGGVFQGLTQVYEVSILDVLRNYADSVIVCQGRSVRYLTPDPVLHYIEEHALYKDARS